MRASGVGEFLVYLFDMKGIFDPASDILLHHEGCELITVYKDNALTRETVRLPLLSVAVLKS